MVFHVTEKLSKKEHIFKCPRESAEVGCQRSGTYTVFKLSVASETRETRVSLLFICCNDIQVYKNYLLPKVAEKSNSLRSYFFFLRYFFFFFVFFFLPRTIFFFQTLCFAVLLSFHYSFLDIASFS